MPNSKNKQASDKNTASTVPHVQRVNGQMVSDVVDSLGLRATEAIRFFGITPGVWSSITNNKAKTIDDPGLGICIRLAIKFPALFERQIPRIQEVLSDMSAQGINLSDKDFAALFGKEASSTYRWKRHSEKTVRANLLPQLRIISDLLEFGMIQGVSWEQFFEASKEVAIEEAHSRGFADPFLHPAGFCKKADPADLNNKEETHSVKRFRPTSMYRPSRMVAFEEATSMLDINPKYLKNNIEYAHAQFGCPYPLYEKGTKKLFFVSEEWVKFRNAYDEILRNHISYRDLLKGLDLTPQGFAVIKRLYPFLEKASVELLNDVGKKYYTNDLFYNLKERLNMAS